MLDTNLKNIKDIINEYGNDLRKYNLEYKNFNNVDFNNIIFPDDKELFQKSIYKSLKYCYFSNLDFSKYNWLGIDLEWCTIDETCILPKDKNFLKNLKGSSIRNVTFIGQDLSFYSFDNVDICGAKFKNNSVLPINKNFFQIIRERNAANSELPKASYEQCNFKDVCLMGTKFTKDSSFSLDKEVFQYIRGKNLNFSTLPEQDYGDFNFKGVSLSYTNLGYYSKTPNDYTFLKKIAGLQQSDLGKDYNDKIHLYDFTDIPCTIRVNGISDLQCAILYRKYNCECENKKIKIENNV